MPLLLAKVQDIAGRALDVVKKTVKGTLTDLTRYDSILAFHVSLVLNLLAPVGIRAAVADLHWHVYPHLAEAAGKLVGNRSATIRGASGSGGVENHEAHSHVADAIAHLDAGGRSADRSLSLGTQPLSRMASMIVHEEHAEKLLIPHGVWNSFLFSTQFVVCFLGESFNED